MILERVEIVGFRGINRLSLMLEQNNVLIGENAWGKSSLLDALTLLLSPESDLYHFERDDFWFPPGDINGRYGRGLRRQLCLQRWHACLAGLDQRSAIAVPAE